MGKRRNGFSGNSRAEGQDMVTTAVFLVGERSVHTAMVSWSCSHSPVLGAYKRHAENIA